LTTTLEQLVSDARARVLAGYYEVAAETGDRPSLRSALFTPGFAVIAEVKLASPTTGRLSAHAVEKLIDDYMLGGAAGISVLTEPRHFGGAMGHLKQAAHSPLPVLMKDFIIDRRQVESAARCGASAVLLIEEVLAPGERSYLIEEAHAYGLEVVLESCSSAGMLSAMGTEADIIALNQRDLATMKVDPLACSRILPLLPRDERPLLVMSGISSHEDAQRARSNGADAVLVGGALSGAADPVKVLRELRSVA
jgi:indole-3-glycerol phosphate synthase